MYEKNYKLLANAIIIQAVEDYRKAETWQARSAIKHFFLSEWFEALTEVDGNMILRRLEQEYKGKEVEKSEMDFDV